MYNTSQVSFIIGVHPNTVRLYEKIEFIEKPKRTDSGYRIFEEIHIDQMRFARLALRSELLQNGLRKKLTEIIKLAANRKWDDSIQETSKYISMLNCEIENANEAITISENLIAGLKNTTHEISLTRKQAADKLEVSIDTLRNWELNGLIRIKRIQNGYRIYDSNDIQLLKIIRTLKCAGHSLMSILRLINSITKKSNTDLTQILNTPGENEDIVLECDKLLMSLETSKNNAVEMMNMLFAMKEKY